MIFAQQKQRLKGDSILLPEEEVTLLWFVFLPFFGRSLGHERKQAVENSSWDLSRVYKEAFGMTWKGLKADLE